MPTKADSVRRGPVILIMGAAGAGKTTVGRELALKLGVPFADGDAFHAVSALEKMRRGEALTDVDRLPWLALLAARLSAAHETGLVLACSALKAEYRDRLEVGGSHARQLAYLHVPAEILRIRLTARTAHFAGPALLTSQLATLEVPVAAETYDGTSSPEDLVREMMRRMGLGSSATGA